MPVKIRLARRGRRKQPFYHIVVADSRSPRDGKFIEQIGSYNPMTSPATIELDRDRAFHWLGNGAQPTHTARAILRFKGILYKKHLQSGVKKGALTQEEADRQFNEFVNAKDSKIRARFEAEMKRKSDYLSKVDGGVKEVKQEVTPEEKAIFMESAEKVAAPKAENTEASSEEE